MFTTGCDSNLDSVYTTEESAKVSQKLATYSVDSNQFDYYWYQGEKIFLKQKTTKQYVLFDAEKKTVVAKAARMADDNSYALKDFKLTCVKAMSKIAKAKNLKWCIIQNSNT